MNFFPSSSVTVSQAEKSTSDPVLDENAAEYYEKSGVPCPPSICGGAGTGSGWGMGEGIGGGIGRR